MQELLPQSYGVIVYSKSNLLPITIHENTQVLDRQTIDDLLNIILNKISSNKKDEEQDDNNNSDKDNKDKLNQIFDKDGFGLVKLNNININLYSKDDVIVCVLN